MDQKIRYEKPVGVQLGPVAPIVGLSCMNGTLATGCIRGTDPHLVYTCNPGNVASSNCTAGNTAAQLCWIGYDADVACADGGKVG